jgi:hypothetical protein
LTGYSTKNNAVLTDYIHKKRLFNDIFDSLLNDVFGDSVVQNLPEKIMNEPIPYFKPLAVPEHDLKEDTEADKLSDEAIKR